MDDPLPKTAQDHYTYVINNFHPSLDNIITISILKVRFEGQVYTGHPEINWLYFSMLSFIKN